MAVFQRNNTIHYKHAAPKIVDMALYKNVGIRDN